MISAKPLSYAENGHAGPQAPPLPKLQTGRPRFWLCPRSCPGCPCQETPCPQSADLRISGRCAGEGRDRTELASSAPSDMKPVHVMIIGQENRMPDPLTTHRGFSRPRWLWKSCALRRVRRLRTVRRPPPLQADRQACIPRQLRLRWRTIQILRASNLRPHAGATNRFSPFRPPC